MQSAIPQGLRTTYLIHFVWELIFGLAGTLAAKFVGDLASHPVHDPDVNALLGVAALALALGSWFAYRAPKWEQISILTAVECFFNLVGGIAGVVAYFVPSILGVTALPAVLLLVSVVLTLFGLAFTYFYTSVQGWRPPLSEK